MFSFGFSTNEVHVELGYLDADSYFSFDIGFSATDITLSSATVNENATGPVVIGTLSNDDFDGTTNTYSIADNDYVELVGNELRLKAGVVLDHETMPTITVEVTATDTKGALDHVTKEIVIAVADLNEAPTVDGTIAGQAATQGTAFSFQFDAAVFGDVDAGDTATYSATLADGSDLPEWLSFDATSRTFSGTPANGDVGDISVKVTITDSGDQTASTTFDLSVTNINDAPTDISLASDLVISGKDVVVKENAKGATIGTLSTLDPDLEDSFSYSVDDDRFTVSGDKLKLRTGVALDFEKEGAVTLTVTSEDAGGLTHDGVFIIEVIDQIDRKRGGKNDEILLGTAGDDQIHARQGDDILKGFGGNDFLRSQGGDDRFWGGTGADTFIFGTGSGHDTIMDFDTTEDSIDIRKWAAIGDLADVKAHASKHGGDLWIEAGRDALIIADLSKKDLAAVDFQFAS